MKGFSVEPGERTAAVLARIRREVGPMTRDRFVAADLEAVRGLVASGALVEAAGLG
jgi:histidine ammonia-lyase